MVYWPSETLKDAKKEHREAKDVKTRVSVRV